MDLLQLREYPGYFLPPSFVYCDNALVRKYTLSFGPNNLENEAEALKLIENEQKELIAPRFKYYSRLEDCNRLTSDKSKIQFYELLKTSKIEGVALDKEDSNACFPWDRMKPEAKDKFLKDLRNYLKQVWSIPHYQVANAGRTMGPVWKRLKWTSPLPVKAFLIDAVRRYTSDTRVLSWAQSRIDTLPDNERTGLMHLDLHPSNIMVRLDSNEFIALVDWETAGFFPLWFQAFNLMIYCDQDEFSTRLRDELWQNDVHERRNLGELVELFRHLHRFAMPSFDPERRLENRQREWKAIREVVGDGVCIEAPNFDYSLLQRNSGAGPGHTLWRGS